MKRHVTVTAQPHWSIFRSEEWSMKHFCSRDQDCVVLTSCVYAGTCTTTSLTRCCLAPSVTLCCWMFCKCLTDDAISDTHTKCAWSMPAHPEQNKFAGVCSTTASEFLPWVYYHKMLVYRFSLMATPFYVSLKMVWLQATLSISTCLHALRYVLRCHGLFKTTCIPGFVASTCTTNKFGINIQMQKWSTNEERVWDDCLGWHVSHRVCE